MEKNKYHLIAREKILVREYTRGMNGQKFKSKKSIICYKAKDVQKVLDLYNEYYESKLYEIEKILFLNRELSSINKREVINLISDLESYLNHSFNFNLFRIKKLTEMENEIQDNS
jgi:hypothetical protein